MRRQAWLVGAALTAGLLAGCVERRFVVTSDPPGAIVLRSGQFIGPAPADDHFVYYGLYHFTLIKDNFETLQVDQEIKPPWYEYWPLDFIFENFVPWQIEDVRRFHYQMQPLQAVSPTALINEVQQLRNRAETIAPQPRPVPAPAPGAPPAATLAPPTGPP